MIHVQDFHKNYDQTVAVGGLTFDVQPGQILGLLGPNGAGKTTTMRAIAGITPATQGRLIVAGHDVAKEPVEAKRNLAYVPDDPKLFDALTVEEHLEFTASAYDVRDYKPLAEQLMSQFELTEQRNKLAQELSRGMRQKVAICCAYLHSPRAILVDEPLTGLDPRGIRTMNQSLKDQAASGAAIIISSHLLALVENLCTHLLILHRGRSLYFGPTDAARSAFEVVGGGDTSLEEVFFRVTEGDGASGGTTGGANGSTPPPVPAPAPVSHP
ncbi:MAG: ABC transporter ATP-binding protein [Anaerolineae bacterium]|nr:ABC transporter ATP-binding protein [Phycisphaerae bacterium]